jgi:hypothetical protein
MTKSPHHPGTCSGSLAPDGQGFYACTGTCGTRLTTKALAAAMSQPKLSDYTRTIEGVGSVEKVMIGKPKGIDSSEKPTCPPMSKEARKALASRIDRSEHLASQIAFEDAEEHQEG